MESGIPSSKPWPRNMQVFRIVFFKVTIIHVQEHKKWKQHMEVSTECKTKTNNQTNRIKPVGTWQSRFCSSHLEDHHTFYKTVFLRQSKENTEFLIFYKRIMNIPHVLPSSPDISESDPTSPLKVDEDCSNFKFLRTGPVWVCLRWASGLPSICSI